MEEALAARLLAYGALTDIIGARLTWNIRDQGAALPCLVLTLVDRVPVDGDEGELGLTEARVQADAYAIDFDTALAIGRLLRTALSGQSFESQGLEFQGTFLDSERHNIERISGEENAHRVSMDFQVWTSE